jgi:hypothetical protein
MTSRCGEGKRSSFVVRVVENRGGEVSGVIERVATGAKIAFKDLEAIGQVIREMLRDAPPHSRSLRRGPTPPDDSVAAMRPELQ